MTHFRCALLLACISAALAAPVSAHERKHQGHQAEKQAVQPADPLARPSISSEWQLFRSHLDKPEYHHVLINPIPVLGMGLGFIFLISAVLRPSWGLENAGLIIVALAGVMTFPTVQLGQRAYDRVYETIPLEAQGWLDVHMERAERFQKYFLFTAGLAVGAFWLRRRHPLGARRLLIASTAASGLCAALGGWISHAGGQVRHEEFRAGPPPASSMHKAEPMSDPSRKEKP